MHLPTSVLLIIISITSTLTYGVPQPQQPHGRSCILDERAALLSFRKGITNDSTNILASWRGQDCCRWRGIKCNNQTGHVVKLHLRNPNPDLRHPCHDANALFGEISPSLLFLKHLEHMDLSMNCLLGPNSQIPHLLGSMGNLRYLNISGIPFTGRVPPQLGNMSKLQYLDIDQLFHVVDSKIYSADINWLTNLPKLKYLGMSGIDLSGTVDWPNTLNMIPSIRAIRLASCSLGTANQSLPYFNLTKLEKLDLSWNGLDHTVGSSWFWKATSITYLNLRSNSLFGQIPHALGNMTSLHFLDFSRNFNKDMVITGHLDNLCNLEVLDFTENDMNGDIAVLMEAFPRCAWKQLQELHLSENNFSGTLPNLIEKFTILNTLDLSNNKLNGSIPSGIGTVSNLVSLDLSYNEFSGGVPSEIRALTNLAYLDLSSNKFSGSVAYEIGALINLATLDLSHNNFSGGVPSEIRALTNLAYLDLSSNKFSGSVAYEIGALINLATLDLSHNNFSGCVPPEIGAVTNLTYLDLSYNNFSGVVTGKNLESLQSLRHLYLSSNDLMVMADPDWDPPFRLESVGFAHCQMGPIFPYWLERQTEIVDLDISMTGLKGKIPDWFWSTFSDAGYLDISHNQISGSLPTHLSNMSVEVLNLASNNFTGPLPSLPRQIVTLDISSNTFSGTLPSYLETPNLDTLLMYSNKIAGEIPESLCKLVYLEYLDFSDNILEGKIPECLGFKYMRRLLLSNNRLTGTFPRFLKNCTYLEFLDLAWNKFHGRLPTWIGEMRSLHILRLGHNAFYGTIPAGITDITNLQYLDISSNNMCGVIPRNLSNLKCMTLEGFIPIELHIISITKAYEEESIFYNGEFGDIFSISTKGQQLRYGGTLGYLVGIDLSGNSLTGGIPTDITFLDAVINLNLSSNQLTGSIPNKIGALHSLESFDLSNNRLSGEIPSSLSSLSSLSYLNLSYNSLSGRIPSGRQLDTLNADNPALIYIGNSGLCGPPLQKNCSGSDMVVHDHPRSSNHGFDPMTFYFGLVLGLVAGLWSVFCAFLFKRTWRDAYFQLVNELYDRIYVYVVVKWASFTRTRDE